MPDRIVLPLQSTSHDTWVQKYQLKDQHGVAQEPDVDASKDRVSKNLAQLEKRQYRKGWEKQFRETMEYCIPAGRIMSNTGAGDLKAKTSLINCVVSNTIDDSMESILTMLHEAGITLKAGCGIGYEFSTLRPKGAHVAGAGASTSGPLSFMDIYDAMCSTISSAGGRRGAQMATFDISHPDVVEFVKVKREDGRLRKFNLSLLITEKFLEAVKNDQLWVFEWAGVPHGTPIRAVELWDLIMKSTYEFAEPGILLIDRINNLNNLWFCENIRATNPCVTGDTLIAVAGRGPVPIKQLAEEGEDVPVYCQDPKTGETLVRMGRNPRKTGIGHKVYRVTLDDGTSFKGNANHGIPLRETGVKTKIKELKAGDSLIPFTMRQSTNGEVHAKSVDGYELEYHLMLDCKYGTKLDFGRGTGKIHGHHMDGDHFNNDMDNLEAIRHADHGSHHLTENNPMQTWWPNASRKERAAYRKSMSEAKSGSGNGMYGLQHSKKTKKLIGRKTSERFAGDSVFAAKHRKAVTKAMRKPETRALLSKIKTKEREIVELVCDWCQEPYELEVIVGTDVTRKFCGLACTSAYGSACSSNRIVSDKERLAKSKASSVFAATRKGRAAKRSAARVGAMNTALKCGSMMLHLGHKISIRTWDSLKPVLQEAGIKRVSTAAWINAQWDGDWKQFIRECKSYNHKVVSVEYVGREDVYNLTVDDVHTYSIVTGTWEDNGKTFWSGICSSNCGEQPLPPAGSCNLGSVLLPNFVRNPFQHNATFDFAALRYHAKVFSRLLDNVCAISGLPLASQELEILSKRRHGMGIMGLGSTMTMLHMSYGDHASVQFTEQVMRTLAIASYEAGYELAKEKGEAPILKQKFEASALNASSGRFNQNWQRLQARKSSYSGRELMLMSHFFDRWYDDEEAASVLRGMEKYGSRYTHAVSIAPAGTISMSFGNSCSNGVEPTFSHYYVRNKIKEGSKAKEAVPVYSYEFLLYKHLVENGKIKHVNSPKVRALMIQKGLDENTLDPAHMPEKFSTADSVTPDQHIAVQEAAQLWTDSSISKTINVPTNMPFDDFKDVYRKGTEAQLKGLTTFRFNPDVFQGVLVRPEDLKNTTYKFVQEDGAVVEVSGDTMIQYEGGTYTAANLFDAHKENFYGKL